MKPPSHDIELQRTALRPEGEARELLRYLCPPPEAASLPDKVEVGHDALQLVNHTAMHQARATQLCNSLSYLYSQAAGLYPEVRRDLAADEEVELPRLRIGDYHEYGLRYNADRETGSVRYTFYRADEGVSEGGFYVIKQADGTIVLARGEYTCYTTSQQGTPDYAHVLLQASRAVEVYAGTLAISEEELKRQMHQDHLSDGRHTELSLQVAKESSRRWKLKTRLSGYGKTAVYQLSRLVTEADPEATMKVPPGRKLSKARIALIALALPFPGSGTIGDSPLPRSASMAVAGGIAGVAADLWPEEAAPVPDQVALYDEQQLDLPDTSILTMNESGQEVALLDRSPEVPVAIPVINSSETTASLGGESPRRVVIDEVLGSQACVRLRIAPQSQNRPISLATTDPAVQSKAEIDASPEALYVCNATDEIVKSGELQFYFDTRN